MASQAPPYSPATPTYNAPNYTSPGYVPQPGAPTFNVAPQGYQTYPANVPPTQPLMGSKPIWGEIPQRHLCQFCNNNVVTEVVYESGGMTWLVAGGLCILGCWLGCCLIPFGVDGCKDVVHICPHCHNTVGRKNRLS